MVKAYPKAKEIDSEIVKDFELAIEAIVSLRRCKVLIDKANQKIKKASIKLEAKADKELIKPFIEKLAKVEEIEFVETKPQNSVVDVSDNLESFISTDEVDVEAIIEKLNRQKAKLEKEIAKLDKMLSNEKFISNAPKEVVENNQKALNEAIEKLQKIEGELSSFS
jgi:valyl-tRNA synthetase